jgi:hypothetical protein
VWTITKPRQTALKTFDLCAAGIASKDLRQRLGTIRPDIQAAETQFDQAAATAQLKQLYNRHMAREGSRGRDIYDKLMMAAEHDICPFCGHRDAFQLDHTLPKTSHPALAVTPVNLVPSCGKCNHIKGRHSPKSSAEQLLNPYYDDVSADRWLHATIVEGSPPAATFRVEAPFNWSGEITARVENHFGTLGLAKLYASQAGRQLQNMRGALRDFYAAGGPAAVREDLERQFNSYSGVRVNSWEGALFQAAAASDWYCDGGFAG